LPTSKVAFFNALAQSGPGKSLLFQEGKFGRVRIDFTS